MNLLVEETNRYASQFFEDHPDQSSTNYFKDWVPCNQSRIKAYLGLIIHMGLSQFPRLEYHWSKTSLYSCNLCPNVMTKKEFFLIHRFLHFADNRSANLEDKLYKLRRFFYLLTQRYRRYYVPNRHLTVDERIVKFTGRLSFLQFVRNKPNQYGIKVYVLADAHTGYVCNWKVYLGAGSERNQNIPGQNENRERRRPAIYNTVLELTNNYTNMGHVLCFDSFYCYPEIFKELAKKHIGCVGTLNKQRRNIPEEIKSPGEMQARETIWRRNGNLMALIFKDKRYIRLLTNIYGKGKEIGNRPLALRDYNLWARGVDLSNQFVSSYHNMHKSLKWYKVLALSFLETSIANAYILYKSRNPFTAKKHLNFREDIVTDLLQSYINERRALSQPIQRITPNLHRIGKREQKHCIICSTKENRKTSVFYCIDCDENVCIVECFYKLHTNLTVFSRNKSRNI